MVHFRDREICFLFHYHIFQLNITLCVTGLVQALSYPEKL